MHIKATLNGISLLAKTIPGKDEFVIDADLMWETDKSSIKRLRAGNASIKVECFFDNTRIGYLLIPLRCAVLIRPGIENKISDKWEKLIDANSYKPYKPELLMHIQISDKDSENNYLKNVSNKVPCKDLTQPFPIMNLKEPVQQNVNLPLQQVSSKNITYQPELCEEEGLIQIGPKDKGNDKFTFTVLVGKAENLNLLVTDIEKQHSHDFYFCCNIMGYTIQASPITDLFSYCSVTNEKVVVRIRSSLKFLQTYFNDISVLTLRLMSGTQEIAFSDIDITSLVPTDNLFDFCSHYAVNNTIAIKNNCYLIISETGEIPKSCDGKPYVEITIKLKYVKGPAQNPYEDEYDFLNYRSQPTFNKDDKCTVDNEIFSTFDVPSTAQIQQDNLISTMLKENNVVAVAGANPFVEPLTAVAQDRYSEVEDEDASVCHKFCLQIILDDIIFHKFPLRKTFFFIFNHSKAEIMPTANCEITVEDVNKYIHLQGIRCKMSFESPIQKIDHDLLTEPPTVSVFCKEDGENVKFAEAELDVGLLLLKKEHLCKVNSAMISNCELKEVIGMLSLSMVLKDYGLQLPKPNNIMERMIEQDIDSLLFNDKIAMKVVEELEEWKEKQQEIFREQLQKKEATHLEALSVNWETKRKDIEAALNNNSEKCSILAQSLQEAAKDLHMKSLKVDEKQIQLKLFEQSLQQEHTFQVRELKEACRRMEDDLKLKVSQFDLEKDELQKKIDILEKENSFLKEKLKIQDEEMTKLNKSSLTRDQTAGLLQEVKSIEEKFEQAVRAKTFFKEQWARSVRELHRIKTEYQKEIQNQIRHNKEELKSLGIDHVLNSEKAELDRDLEVIEKIRSEIVNTTSGRGGLGDAPNKYEFTPSSYLSGTMSTPALHLMMQPKVNCNSSTNTHSAVEPKLSRLVDEVDSLLKTGSYSVDDPVIIKLKDEIRNLHMQHSQSNLS